MDLGKYLDAISCLQQTLKEGRKPRNVDIRLMLSNIHKIESIIKELQDGEDDNICKASLNSVAESLSGNAAVLNRKIRNLNLKDYADMEWEPNRNPNTNTYLDKKNKVEIGLSPVSSVKTPNANISGSNNPLNTPENSSKSCSSMDYEDPCSTPECTDSHEQVRKTAIESTISRPSNITFDQVIGLETAKQALREAVITPLLFPHLFSDGHHSWRRILLYGPPGTGKSRLAQALSAEVKATFYAVSSTDLISSWVGQTEKLIKDLFQHARTQQGQSVVFIDEIDSLCRKRNSREDESTRRIKTELLIQMDGKDRRGQDKIFLLCATNCPFDLDTAFLRRFHKRIYIPLPDRSSRLGLLQLHCGQSKVSLDSAEWDELAAKTDGYSGSDLSTLVMAALMIPISELQLSSYWTFDDEDHWVPCDKDVPNAVSARSTDLPTDKIRPRAAVMKDFLQSLSDHRPTVSEAEIQNLENFTSNYGQTA